jgi:pimeloyl-ACP methyl ester carboxylesterase
VTAVTVQGDFIQSGPDDADHGVLLLPGGGCPAEQFRLVMEEPALARTRLVAATLPGHAGTPPPEDRSVSHYADLAARWADEHRCDVVVGFSMGATVALEMVTSGRHTGPLVLLGVSLSTDDEPAFFRAFTRISAGLGHRPVGLLMRGAAMAARRAPVPAEHAALMSAALRRNKARDIGPSLTAYVAYLGEHDKPAERLCRTGVPTWVAHTEKGDGGLTADERQTLEHCASVQVITLPGASFLLPDERPAEVAAIIADAVRAAGER